LAGAGFAALFDQLVGATEEDFARPVLPLLSTQRTLYGDRLEREFLQAGGHVAAAPLAGDHEGLAA
jgi:hypothetical protein